MKGYRISTLRAFASLFFFLALLPASALAQVPLKISVQAVVEDGGMPLNDASATLTFRLWTDATGTGGSALLWTETQAGLSVTNGLVSVLLGEVTPLQAAFFTQPLWLGVSVGNQTATELAPRIELAAAPYALATVGSGSGGGVTTLNGLAGAVTVQGEGGATVRTEGNTLIVGAGSSGGNGIQGIQNTDGALTILNPNGPTASINLNAGGVVTTNLADGAVTGAKLAAGAIMAGTGVTVSRDASQNVVISATGGSGGTGWNLGGNAGTTAGTNFLGTTDNVPLEIKVNGQRVMRYEPETATEGPNVLGGWSGNSIEAGVVGGTIAGGGGLGDPSQGLNNSNMIGGGNHATIGGGLNIEVDGSWATVSGGLDNSARAERATIGGGNQNQANAPAATISGGMFNTAAGAGSAISGGQQNFTTSEWATISGGFSNEANGIKSSVGGGHDNNANGEYATVSGGFSNEASGQGATVGGGALNEASWAYAQVGGGRENTAGGIGATVGGGTNNMAGGGALSNSTVSGGLNNLASSETATVGGGSNNTASGIAATVGGGTNNTADGYYATVGGGWENTASGQFATVPGGNLNQAGGDYSFAAGRLAHADHDGAFVWGDSEQADYVSTSSNQFLIRASGGVGIGTNSPNKPLTIQGRGTNAEWIGLLDEDGTAQWHFNDNSDGLNFAETNVGDYRLFLQEGGNVGIGTSSPGFKLHVNGTAGKPGGGSWSVASDGRLKDVGAAFNRGLEAIKQLQPVSYRYKADNPLGLPAEVDYIGFVAQQVETVIPEAVERNASGYLHVNNDPILWTMLNAIQELAEENAALRAQIAGMKTVGTEVDQVRGEIAALRALVTSLTAELPSTSTKPRPE